MLVYTTNVCNQGDLWTIQHGNRKWNIHSAETTGSILPDWESRISLTSLWYHSDSRILWNLFGLCVNNSRDSGIIQQSSKTGILILNSRDDNSCTALNRLSTHSTFPQIEYEWHDIKCPQSRNALFTFSWRHILQVNASAYKSISAVYIQWLSLAYALVHHARKACW